MDMKSLIGKLVHARVPFEVKYTNNGDQIVEFVGSDNGDIRTIRITHPKRNTWSTRISYGDETIKFEIAYTYREVLHKYLPNALTEWK